jgi:fido (protein-threonine AMPylation protein)
MTEQGRNWEDVVFATDHFSSALTRAVRRGRLRRLARGIYTGDLTSDPGAIVLRNLWSIVAHEFPGAVISDRSVPSGGMPKDGLLFVVHDRQRPVTLPGVEIVPRVGPRHVEGDMELPEGIWISSTERSLLDNLAPARSTMRHRRTLTQAEIEDWIELLLQQRGEAGLNELRDRARSIAPKLGREREFTNLSRLISAALMTRDDVTASSLTLEARLEGSPFDAARISLFEGLAAYLLDVAPVTMPALETDKARRALLPFYEAYFSNFIEGTEFTLDEAADICFERHVPPSRPADAHDILGTFEIVSDSAEMMRTPEDPDELEALLRSRHAILMTSRPENRPGAFKTVANRAGSTLFVQPDLVSGTLRRGFDLGRELTSPFARAAYLMFLVAEVHPFSDGNGRIARVMMNAEFEAAGEIRTIIPTVYRSNYLSALSAASHGGYFQAFDAMLTFAWRWTARVDFTDRRSAEHDLTVTNALRSSVEADAAGVRLVMPG